MQFRSLSSERLMIDSVASRLTDDENALRMLLIERTIQARGRVNLGELIGAGVLPPEARALVERLTGKRAVVLDGEDNVALIPPVSALPTRHQVSLEDGRRFFAMCAVDAMGTAFTLEQNVEIESACSECGRRISVRIEEGRLAEIVPPDIRILHVDLKKPENWTPAV